MKGFIVFLCTVLMAWAVCAADRFLPGTEDVPLYQGLTVQANGDEDVVFDTPAGEIVVVESTGDVRKQSDIRRFYEVTLPALGWEKTGDLTFVRDDQQLEMTIMPKGKTVLVRFEITPKN